MNTKRCINRKGSVLSIVSVMVVVLSITGLGMLKITQSSQIRSARLVAQIAAQNAADTGINRGVEYVYNLWNANAPDLIDIDYTSQTYTLPGSGTQASYYYTVNLCDNYPGYEITSCAAAAGMTKQIHYRMVIQHPWVGIASKSGISINVGTGIETQPAEYPDFTLITNSIINNSIVLRNGVLIPGDIVVGPGGNTDTVIDTKNDAVILGRTWSMLEQIFYPDVVIPDSLVYTSLGTDPNDSSLAIMNTSGKYGSITIDTGETLKVVGNITAVIQGSLIANNGATFLITEGSSLVLYMDGNIELKNGAIFSNENFSSEEMTYEQIRDATKSVKIFGTTSCTVIDLKNSSMMAGALYAPYATVNLFNTADVFGAVMANNVNLKNSGNFIFVFGLYDDKDKFVSNLLTQRGSWREI